MTKNKQKIVIIGGGFGGIKAALELSEHDAFDIKLISDQPNFRYYPTLYNIAVGKSHLGASIALADIFKDKNVEIIQASAVSIDRENMVVKDSKKDSHSYDKLIMALGVVTNFFGIKGLEENSFGIKTIEEAQRLRDHLHKQLIDDKKPDVNYVIIGGGPTGVELAGALPSYIHKIMKKHGLRDRKVHIDLIEAAPRLMPRMSKSYSRAIARQLRGLGVKLYLKQAVQDVTPETLNVSGHSIESHTIIWTAGVTNHPFFKQNNFQLNERGKVLVDQYLQTEPNIYVIGDNADTKYSGMAQTALYDGVYIAKSLKTLAEGKVPEAYKPKEPIYITPAGPGWAAVQWGKMHSYGWIGWALREAADMRGYKDYTPWWLAAKHYLAKDDEEESCPTCREI